MEEILSHYILRIKPKKYSCILKKVVLHQYRKIHTYHTRMNFISQ